MATWLRRSNSDAVNVAAMKRRKFMARVVIADLPPVAVPIDGQEPGLQG